MQKFLITILFTLFLSFTANAENHLHEDKLSPEDSDVETFNFYWTQMPAVCAPRQDIAEWIVKHEFTPVSVSFGRTGGKPDGAIVYIVTLFTNDKYEQTTTVQTPGGNEVCILYKTFDMKLNPNLGKQGLNL